MAATEERLSEELKIKRICRFCLTQEEPLSDIFSRDGTAESSGKKTTPLTLQIMACVSIEVYKDDDMPSTICDNCRQLMDHSYRFKQICKKADTLLKTYPLTGVWPEKLQVPVNLFKSVRLDPVAKPNRPTQQQPKVASVLGDVTVKRIPAAATQAQQETKVVKQTVTVMKASPVKQSQPPVSIVTNRENQVNVEEQQIEGEADVKPKIVKLSIEDLKNIKQGKPISRTQLIKKSPVSKGSEVKILHSEVVVPPRRPVQDVPLKHPKKSPVKVINGTLNRPTKKPVILNSLQSTKKTEEHFIQTSEGTLEIVSMEAPEVDPIKNAPPVETNVFPCAECERSFPLRQLLDIHMQNHNRERNHPCEMCDKRFFSKYDLAKHNLTHTGERPYVCVICKAAFSRSTLLTRHQKIHKDQPKFLCMYCERTFLSKEELQKHSEHHKKKRPFQCTKCPKSFAYKQGLERHEVAHETNLPFPCEHCDLTFATAGKLARHLTAHAGSRPYPCRMCSRSFMLSHHLTRHVRGHAGGQGAYKCNECTSIFYSQDDLIYHSAVHATKNLTCPLCRERFESLEQVTDHIKQHSEGVQYACDYCDLLFTSEHRLDSHCQEEHLEVLATDRDETDQNASANDSTESANEFIIEEIAINTDGSRMITTFVNGEQKETTFMDKNQKPVIKSEFAKQEKIDEQDLDDEQQEEEYFYEEEVEDEQVEKEPVPDPLQSSNNDMKKKVQAAVSVEKQPVPVMLKALSSYKSKLTETPKSTQQKLDTFFKKSYPGSSVSATKTVGEVLKNLPKGMVIKKPAASTPADKKPESKLPTDEKQMSPKTAIAHTGSPKKPLPVLISPKKEGKVATPPTKIIPEKSSPTKSSPRIAAKRPNEDAKTPSPAKKFAAEPKKTTQSSNAAPSKPCARPVSTSSPSAIGSGKKSKTFEMMIGDKMVKVQKVVMTKAEVAAMARDGKIEMQGDTMILKQPKARK